MLVKDKLKEITEAFEKLNYEIYDSAEEANLADALFEKLVEQLKYFILQLAEENSDKDIVNKAIVLLAQNT